MRDTDGATDYWLKESAQCYTVLTDDSLATLPEKQELNPEAMLMLAVLQDAIACLKGEGSARPHERARLARMARDWMLDEGREDLFSFCNICATLLLNPQAIRKVLHLGIKRISTKPLTLAPRAMWPSRSSEIINEWSTSDVSQ